MALKRILSLSFSILQKQSSCKNQRSINRISIRILVLHHKAKLSTTPKYMTIAAAAGSPTLRELKIKLAQEMGVEPGYIAKPPDRSHLSKYLPKTQEELPKRSMNDSFVVAYLPLSRDKILQEKYVSYLAHVRVGRLLEDMDIFAVMVAHKHIVIPHKPPDVPFPQTLVTAFVDRIDFTSYHRTHDQDIKLSGHVSYVGKTSMEVVVWVEQMGDGKWNRVTRALFMMVARDATNSQSAIVNAIEPANEREKKIFAKGTERTALRRELSQRHLSKVVPNTKELEAIHAIYLRTTHANEIFGVKTLPPNCVWMRDTVVSNVIFTHPEDRNLHNTIFGGFIMRQAGELSWTTACLYAHSRPRVKSISDINFRRAIQVNSLMQIHAQIVYTEMNFMQVLVLVEARNPVTGEATLSNTFHFTYVAPELEKVKEVLPLSYHEAMLFVDGRRHFYEVQSRGEK